jgi:hypothetical protein
MSACSAKAVAATRRTLGRKVPEADFNAVLVEWLILAESGRRLSAVKKRKRTFALTRASSRSGHFHSGIIPSGPGSSRKPL